MITESVNPIAEFFQSADTKFYVALAGILWAAFKGFNWVKDIRDEDLKGIKHDLRDQTSIIATGLATLGAIMDRGFQEMRNDFRTFYTSPDPLMVPVNARTTRKRKSVAVRTKAKAVVKKKTV